MLPRMPETRFSYEHFEKAVNWLDSNREIILKMAKQYHESHPNAAKKLHLADYLRSALNARMEGIRDNTTFPEIQKDFLHPVWKTEVSRLKRREQLKLHTHAVAYDHIAERLEAGETPAQIIAPRFKPLELSWLKIRTTDGLPYTGFGSLPAYFRIVFGRSIPDYPLSQIHDDFETGKKRNPIPVEKPKTQKPVPKPQAPPIPPASLVKTPAATVIQKPTLKRMAPTQQKIEPLNPLTALDGHLKRDYRGMQGLLELAGDVVNAAITKNDPRLLELDFWQKHVRLKPAHADIKNNNVKGKKYAGHGSWREFLRKEANCPEKLLPNE